MKCCKKVCYIFLLNYEKLRKGIRKITEGKTEFHFILNKGGSRFLNFLNIIFNFNALVPPSEALL